MNVATVLESSLPDSIMRKHKGIISVVNKKLITSCSSVFTRAPITPRLVSRRYSKGRVLLTVCKKGYKKSGMCAARNADLEEKHNPSQGPEFISKDSEHSISG